LAGAAGSSHITELRHVRTSAEKRAAEEIANRQKCEDFDRFKPIFEQVQQDILSGVRETRPFELKAEIRPGSLFIVGRQKAYVADMGEVFTNAQGRTDARLRVIFDNGTESNILCARFSARCTRMRRADGLPIPLPVHSFLTSTRTMIRRRVPSTCCERLPGGTCTHWKAPPYHGAHPSQTLVGVHSINPRIFIAIGIRSARLRAPMRSITQAR
jgi:hypothetical protein